MARRARIPKNLTVRSAGSDTQHWFAVVGTHSTALAHVMLSSPEAVALNLHRPSVSVLHSVAVAFSEANVKGSTGS